jgi:hypothetical protein
MECDEVTNGLRRCERADCLRRDPCVWHWFTEGSKRVSREPVRVELGFKHRAEPHILDGVHAFAAACPEDPVAVLGSCARAQPRTHPRTLTGKPVARRIDAIDGPDEWFSTLGRRRDVRNEDLDGRVFREVEKFTRDGPHAAIIAEGLEPEPPTSLPKRSAERDALIAELKRATGLGGGRDGPARSPRRRAST